MFLCSVERRFFRPGAISVKRRAQRLTTLTEGDRGTRREAVLTAVSTERSLCIAEAANDIYRKNCTWRSRS